MIRSGELPAAFLDSLRTLLFGFAIASVLGISLLIGRYRTVEAATDAGCAIPLSRSNII